jgi:anti-anti-sigma factor
MLADRLTVVVNHIDSGEMVLTVHGEVDVATAPALRAAAATIEGLDVRFVFDLAGVTFLDSSGLGVIGETAIRLQQSSGSLCLRNAPPAVRKLLAISGLNPFVTVEDDDNRCLQTP